MADQPSDSSEQEWRLDTRKTYGMAALATLVGCLGLFGFGGMSYLLGSAQALAFSVRVSPEQALIVIVLILGLSLGIGLGMIAATVILFLMHEWCHGLAFRAMGATPRYGAKMIAWFFPVLYATAPGRWLTRWQYYFGMQVAHNS
jgi:hypothetical protein